MTVRLDVQGTLDKFERRVGPGARSQLKFAAAKALTQTAFQVREGMKDEIRSTFHSPVAMTVNSVLYKGATKERLSAFVFLRDEASKGTPPVRYLSPQIQGGPRSVKRFERALQAAGILPKGMFAVPAKGLPLDANGNIPRGVITRILSDLRSSPDPMQNSARPGSRGRGGGRKKRTTRYFAVGVRRGRLPPGVYERWGSRAIRGVLMFVRAPMYQKRFRFYEKANEIANARFRRNMAEALRHAIRTAR